MTIFAPTSRAWTLMCGAAGLAVIACTPQTEPETPDALPTAPEMTPSGAASSQPSAATDSAPQSAMSASAKQAYAAGKQAFEQGDLAGARAQFQRAVQQDPRAHAAHHSLGVVMERQGELAAAAAQYQRAASLAPDFAPAVVAYALLLARQNNAAKAAEYINRHIARMPTSAALSAAMAEIKSLQGDSAAAQRYAQEALKKDPDFRPAMVVLARDHYRNRRLDLAAYALRGILDGYGPENPPRDKNNAEALLIRGLINKEQGRRGPAIDDFERAIELRPDLVEARLQLATYLLEAGNAQEAVKHLEAAVRYDNTNVLAHLNLGDAYRLLGRSAQAKTELEWVAAAAPSLAQAQYNLGLLFLLNDIPGVPPITAAGRAIAHFEKYKSMRPRSGGPDDTDELIMRAKTKKALLEAKQTEQTTATQGAGTQGTAAQGGQATPAQPAQETEQ